MKGYSKIISNRTRTVFFCLSSSFLVGFKKEKEWKKAEVGKILVTHVYHSGVREYF